MNQSTAVSSFLILHLPDIVGQIWSQVWSKEREQFSLSRGSGPGRGPLTAFQLLQHSMLNVECSDPSGFVPFYLCALAPWRLCVNPARIQRRDAKTQSCAEREVLPLSGSAGVLAGNYRSADWQSAVSPTGSRQVPG